MNLRKSAILGFVCVLTCLPALATICSLDCAADRQSSKEACGSHGASTHRDGTPRLSAGDDDGAGACAHHHEPGRMDVPSSSATGSLTDATKVPLFTIATHDIRPAIDITTLGGPVIRSAPSLLEHGISPERSPLRI